MTSWRKPPDILPSPASARRSPAPPDRRPTGAGRGTGATPASPGRAGRRHRTDPRGGDRRHRRTTPRRWHFLLPTCPAGAHRPPRRRGHERRGACGAPGAGVGLRGVAQQRVADLRADLARAGEFADTLRRRLTEAEAPAQTAREPLTTWVESGRRVADGAPRVTYPLTAPGGVSGRSVPPGWSTAPRIGPSRPARWPGTGPARARG